MTREDLLEERKRILGELSAVDVLLKTRYNVQPEPPPAPPVTAPAPSTARNELETGGRKSDSESLPYSELAREWVKSQSGLVTIKDFRRWLESRKPATEINNASLNAPLKRLLIAGALKVVKEGSGRAPTVYSVVQGSLSL